MTHTSTETFEQRAWRLALEATDPLSPPERRQAQFEELTGFLSATPEKSLKRITAAIEMLIAEADQAPSIHDVRVVVSEFELGIEVELSARVSRHWWSSVRPTDKLVFTVTQVTEKTARS